MLILYAACTAVLLDLVFGDPAWLPHPVVWMGRYITWFERTFRKRFEKNASGLRLCGAILALTLPLFVFLLSGLVCYAAFRLHPVLFVAAEAFLGAQTLAAKGLKDAAMRVYHALQADDTEAAREAVSHIVGRDTKELTREQIIRACVESVAENFSDGVAAPMLFFFLGGAPLALAYKAVNTMDSMTGYRNERYLDFGRIPAKLDDVVNYIPARIAALCLLCASGFNRLDTRRAFAVWRRDANKLDSPNAGQTESVMAGALGIALGGDAVYFGQLHKKAVLGDALRPCERADIKTANRMMLTAEGVLFMICIVVRVFLCHG